MGGSCDHVAARDSRGTHRTLGGFLPGGVFQLYF
jgi:hypothetical protein